MHASCFPGLRYPTAVARRNDTFTQRYWRARLNIRGIPSALVAIGLSASHVNSDEDTYIYCPARSDLVSNPR